MEMNTCANETCGHVDMKTQEGRDHLQDGPTQNVEYNIDELTPQNVDEAEDEDRRVKIEESIGNWAQLKLWKSTLTTPTTTTPT